jgi:hypothetical protein
VEETRNKLSEDFERMKKKNNVIIYNSPESDAATLQRLGSGGYKAL